VQETVFELLTQQYEMSRIEEAKDIPVVSVIDPPGLPEKKSFPPRLLLALILTTLATAAACLLILLHNAWLATDTADPAKSLATEVLATLRNRTNLLLRRGAA
jgi:uncharacterized protein involved in exopolysaccharide biosynthesis